MDTREQDALAKGATPGIDDPGLAGTLPTGGGMAVPPDTALMGSGALGDTGSLDDAGGPGSPDIQNTGTSLADDAGIAERGSPDQRAAAPQSNPDDSAATTGDAPIGGLSAGGAIGGAPTGAANTGAGSPSL